MLEFSGTEINLFYVHCVSYKWENLFLLVLRTLYNVSPIFICRADFRRSFSSKYGSCFSFNAAGPPDTKKVSMSGETRGIAACDYKTL